MDKGEIGRIRQLLASDSLEYEYTKREIRQEHGIAAEVNFTGSYRNNL